jgi:hypothetical protein
MMEVEGIYNRRRNMRRAILAAAVLLALAAVHCAWADGTGPPGISTLWSQAPDLNGGIAYSSEVSVPSTVADNWTCLDQDFCIPSLSWYGSYWKPFSAGAYAPNSGSFANADSGGILGFTISIWDNVAGTAGVPFDHPGEAVWSYWATSFSEVKQDPTVDGRDVYQYSVVIPNEKEFVHTQGMGASTYWISIVADVRNHVGTYDTTRQWGWLEAANGAQVMPASVQDFKYSQWYTLRNNLYSSDMAFTIEQGPIVTEDAPEPGSIACLALGAIGLWGTTLRRRKQQ